MAGMGLLVVLGVIDDKLDMPASAKMAGQVGACLIVCVPGETVIRSLGTLPGGNELLLGSLALPLTVIALVGLINAINMIDGLDGLAGGLSILALGHLILAMHLIGKPLDGRQLLDISIILAALAAFLLFNLGLVPGRKIFLGDAGSMMLGLFIGYQLIDASQREPLTDTLPTSLVPWMVALPVFDTLRLIFSRLRNGRSPLSPDRTHLHHLLLDKGQSPRWSLMVILIAAGLLFWLGVVISAISSLTSGLLFIFLLGLYMLSIGR